MRCGWYYKINGKKCCLGSCKTSYRDDPCARIFKFPPANTKVGEIWRSRCGIQNDLKRQLFLCSLHFEAECMGKKYLKKNSVPSLNLPSTDEQLNSGNWQEAHDASINETKDERQIRASTPEETLASEHVQQQYMNETTEIKQENLQDEWSIFDCSETNFIYQETYANLVNFDPPGESLNQEIPQDNSLDNACSAGRKRKRNEADKDNRVPSHRLNCMESLLDKKIKRDEHSIYGEYIAERFRSCSNKTEIIKAKERIETILNELSSNSCRTTGGLKTEQVDDTSFVPDIVIKTEPDV